VALLGDYAYVAAASAGLRIVNVSDPANPTGVGFYDMAGGAMAVAVVGSYAYVADSGSQGGLRIIDISDPEHPSEPGVCCTVQGSAHAVAVAGDYAYYATSFGLHIIDIHDPATPNEVGHYATGRGHSDVVVVGAYAFVADTHPKPGRRGTGSVA
jgi:hypothetical protein